MPLEDVSLFETTGFSMWPFLRAGEKLLIKRASIEDLRVGDIILYRTDNQLVCHRLVKKIKNKEGYLLYSRGDNSSGSGELVIKESLIGKVTGVVRKGRLINLTGRRGSFVSWLIVWFGPCLGISSRMIKRFISRSF